MKTTRLEAFSDGVIAIIITIMVLELHVPEDHSPRGLLRIWPVFFSYVLSFITVAIYWVNHHHLIHLAHHANGKILWSNMNLLFWISLFPFSTAFLGESHTTPIAVMIYGAVAAAAAISYYFLQCVISAQHASDPRISALHEHLRRKGLKAIGIYLLSLPLAFVSTWLALALIALPALMYFMPDSKIEANQVANELHEKH